MMTKMIIAAKLVNLCSALKDCGIPAEIMYQGETNEPILLAGLWNCEDGSAIRLEVCEGEGCEEGMILAVANPIGCTYEELEAFFNDDDEDEE